MWDTLAECNASIIDRFSQGNKRCFGPNPTFPPPPTQCCLKGNACWRVVQHCIGGGSDYCKNSAWKAKCRTHFGHFESVVTISGHRIISRRTRMSKPMSKPQSSTSTRKMARDLQTPSLLSWGREIFLCTEKNLVFMSILFHHLSLKGTDCHMKKLGMFSITF